MKVISVRQQNNKEANIFDGFIERGKGIYQKVMDVFDQGDSEYAQEMITDLQEEEMEKRIALEALRDGSPQVVPLNAEGEDFGETNLRLSDALASQKDVKIGYFTYKNTTYIERTIRPEYVFYAKTTRNNVLMSWCYDWGDYRAFIIDNIVFVEDLDDKNIG